MLARKGIQAQCFADDCCVIIQGENPRRLEKEMNDCLKWMLAWAHCYQIRFNPSKTKAILFSRNKKASRVRLQMGNEEVELVENFRYLGIHFDRKLNWKAHLTYISKKATGLVHSLKRGISTKWGLTGQSFKHAYEMAIQPVLLYGALVWGSVLQHRCNQIVLEKVQRQAMLALTGALRTSSNSALFLVSGLAPIQLKVQERMMTHYGRIMSTPEIKERVGMDRTVEERRVHQTSIEWIRERFPATIHPRPRREVLNPPRTKKLNVRLNTDQQSILPPPTDPQIKIFTDASKLNESDNVGIGVVDMNTPTPTQLQYSISSSN